MGAPLGNRNGAKAGVWRDSLRRALARFEGDGIKPGEALAKIATVVVAQALSGDKDAIAEIGNRLDGKASQSVDINKTVTHVHSRESLTAELARIHARLAGEGISQRTVEDSGTASGTGTTH